MFDETSAFLLVGWYVGVKYAYGGGEIEMDKFGLIIIIIIMTFMMLRR